MAGRAMKRWAKWLGLALVPLALGLAAWLGPRTLRAIPLFHVRRVELRGARHFTAPEIAAALKLGPKASIFDPTSVLAQRLVAVNGIRDARVGRRLLGTLVIDIEERLPVALAPIGGRLVLVDRVGRSLPFEPTRAARDWPIATPDSAVTGVLDRLSEAEPELARRVISGRRTGETVVLETANRRLLLRVGASVKDIQALALVETLVERRALAVAELDARFDGRVLARGRRA